MTGDRQVLGLILQSGLRLSLLGLSVCAALAMARGPGVAKRAAAETAVAAIQ